ncbi:MAG: hypothetical protein Q8Q44_19565, partial [Nocardioides sp.]|nr:hypothetical protein [Nocardioides sp.]
MRATYTQDQLDLEKTVRSLAEGERGRARECLDAGWSELPLDAGLLRDFSVLGVPESAGGVGSSLVDLMIAVEVLGRSVVPSQFPAHAAAVQLALAAGHPLDDALEGRERWTLAVDEPRVAGWEELRASGPAPALKTLVPYVGGADRIVSLGTDGVVVTTAAEVVVRESLDASRTLADVRLEAAQAGPAGLGPQRAALVAAAELCGLAQGAIDLAAGYARGRKQ